MKKAFALILLIFTTTLISAWRPIPPPGDVIMTMPDGRTYSNLASDQP